jgi:uncharacterized Zn ribbon protein
LDQITITRNEFHIISICSKCGKRHSSENEYTYNKNNDLICNDCWLIDNNNKKIIVELRNNMMSFNNNNSGPRGEDIVKIYEDKHGDYTILAVFEGDYVRWSRGEQGDNGVEGEEVSTIQEFQKMIQKEGWRELYYNNKK